MTLANFKTYVKQIYKRTDKDTEITQAYNDAISAASLKMPHGAYKYQSWVNCGDGQEDYALPSTIIHIMHPIRLLDGSTSADSGIKLEHITKEEYDRREPNPNRTSPAKGYPSAYAIYSGSILLTPIPDSADYIIEIDWTKRKTALSADDDLPALGSEWDEVLRQMVLARMYELVELFQEAQYWRVQYEAPDGAPIGLYRDLLRIEQDKELIGIGRVKPNNL
jgi:hypothetical protein